MARAWGGMARGGHTACRQGSSAACCHLAPPERHDHGPASSSRDTAAAASRLQARSLCGAAGPSWAGCSASRTRVDFASTVHAKRGGRLRTHLQPALLHAQNEWLQPLTTAAACVVGDLSMHCCAGCGAVLSGRLQLDVALVHGGHRSPPALSRAPGTPAGRSHRGDILHSCWTVCRACCGRAAARRERARHSLHALL